MNNLSNYEYLLLDNGKYTLLNYNGLVSFANEVSLEHLLKSNIYYTWNDYTTLIRLSCNSLIKVWKLTDTGRKFELYKESL